MARFKCNYCETECNVSNVKFRVSGDDLVADPPVKCYVCKREMVLLMDNLTVGDIAFSTSRFDSLSDKEKKEVLGKRAKAHFEKFDKAERELKRNQVINQTKEAFERNIER